MKNLQTFESFNVSETENVTHYMFFENLKIIQKSIEKMLELDPKQVDELLSKGHDWASDHIATSKDDIEEVCGWLCNNKEEPAEKTEDK